MSEILEPAALPSSLHDYVEPLLGVCYAAGEAICRHYHSAESADFESKGDDSPLTAADMASDKILSEGLLALGGEIPILSEESAPEVKSQRREWQHYWLIDPLDGTREFLDRTDQFTVNIALIDSHRPVLGILYKPLEKCAYVGIPGLLAKRFVWDDSKGWEATSLQTSTLREGEPIVLLASSRHRGRRLLQVIDWLQQEWGEVQRNNSGSALKFCQMADGLGDFYPRFSPCCEWDTAAGQAVLEAAGGALLGMDGTPLRYNCRDSLYSPHFYGVSDRENPLWRQLINVNWE